MIWDDELKRDLDLIAEEKENRKKRREPYADWNMQEQLKAIERFNKRDGDTCKDVQNGA